MKEDFPLLKTLNNHALSNIDIAQIVNYLETLDYVLNETKYLGMIVSKNERLAKYFFLRDQLKLDINSSDKTLYINEIFDQCIDWNEFWRLLVIKKGFCCIRLSGDERSKARFIFLYGPNILSGSSEAFYDSIYEDQNY